MNNPFPSLIWTICLQWVTFNFDVPTSIYKINDYTSLYFLILHILHYTFFYFVIILLSSFSLIPLYYLSSYYHFSIMNSSLIYLFLPPSYIISSIISFSPSNILVYDIWHYMTFYDVIYGIVFFHYILFPNICTCIWTSIWHFIWHLYPHFIICTRYSGLEFLLGLG